MRPPSTILGGLLLAGGVLATPADLERRAACNEDDLHRCFLGSMSLASQYCSQSITLPGPTGTATVTPTVTVTSTIAITDEPRLPGKAKRAKKAKRGNCKPRSTQSALGLGCFNGQPGTVAYSASQLTSACSCIGITGQTYSATITGTTATITEFTTATISICPTNTVFLTETETETKTIMQTTSSPYDVTATATSVSTVTEIQIEITTEVQTTTEVKTDTTTEIQTDIKTEVSTQISSVTITEVQTEMQTTTATTVSTVSASASACPDSAVILQNGNFESGNLDHWQVTSISVGSHAESAAGGSRGSARALVYSNPYPVFSTTSGAEFKNKLNCVAGALYSISVDIQILTAQGSGNPWSVKVQGVSFASGTGSTTNPAVWNTYSTTFVCSATAADRAVVVSAVSNYLRGGSFSFDNFIVYPLSVPN